MPAAPAATGNGIRDDRPDKSPTVPAAGLLMFGDDHHEPRHEVDRTDRQVTDAVHGGPPFRLSKERCGLHSRSFPPPGAETFLFLPESRCALKRKVLIASSFSDVGGLWPSPAKLPAAGWLGRIEVLTLSRSVLQTKRRTKEECPGPSPMPHPTQPAPATPVFPNALD